MRVLHASDYRVMPWKNGLGTTTEVAVDPPGAGLDAFTWRVSIADLTVSGPFSAFAGYDRVIAQLDGEPMTLTHEGRGEHRLALLAPHRFAGEVATHATLTTAARDFNVMVRRERASAEVRAGTLAPGEALGAEGDEQTRLVYLVRGAAFASTGRERLAIEAGETLLAGPGAEVAVVAEAQGAAFFLISIGPAGRYAAPS
ncbi:MAG: HutD family protein [Minicystis sp.]